MVPRQRLWFRILGPLEVEDEAGPLVLRGRKQRALLGLLLLHAGEVVSSDRLVEELWGEHPPATAASSLRNLVTQLRKVLGAETIVTRPPGYVLEVDPDRLDLARFARLLTQAREVEPRTRVALLRDALTLWRGPPLADLAFERFAQSEIRRLEELRLEAVEERFEAELALGKGPELVPELEALVEAQPMRERLRAHLLLALYRAGRQAEALDAYQAARRTLLEELGVDPSPALQELQRAILRQDPSLAPPPRREPTPRLPPQPTPFVGRMRELAEIVALLQRADVRLLTLTGTGGSGKTRLALRAASEVAPDYPDGVWWVPLASVRDPNLLAASIAQALAIKDEQQLAERIGDRRLLLLVDNCEHLVAAAPRLADLLTTCPNVNVLATSRESLHLASEREYLVPALAEEEALELFRQRAHTAEPEQAVLAICRRLDSLPLAIELAAARTKLLPPERLLQRLDRRLPVLTGGPRDAPERHRTLEATIAWSYDLLKQNERRLFALLAVFAGGCTLEAAEQVCEADLDTLQSLVEKNLLRRDGVRFTMLETIREYAAERLEKTNDGDAALRRRHAEYFRDVAETMRRKEDSREVLTAELDNLRAALRWAIDANDSELALRLATRGLAEAFFSANPTETRRWLEDALALPTPTNRALITEALRLAGRLASETGDHGAAVQYLRRSLADSRRVGDPTLIAMALVGLSMATLAQAPEQTREPRKLLMEALDICEGLSDIEFIAVHVLGELELRAGNNAKAKSLLERALSLGPDERSRGQILGGLGDVALNERDFDRAGSFYRESLFTSRNLRDERDIAYCLAGLSAIAAAQGQTTRAGRLAGAAERIEERRKVRLFLPNPRYERLLEAALVAPEDVHAGRGMTLDEAVRYALEPTA